jgi:type III restriction enzyme
VRAELIGNHHIPPEEIVVATGEEKGLEQIDADYRLGVADPACPVKFIITQKALAEGWDCPFACILVSMASLHSATAVEQLLGRVLRQPGASHRSSRLLNQSYAFVVSRNFAETANALRERLVTGTGFERREVSEFVTAATSKQARLDLDGHAGRVFVRLVTIALPEKPDLKGLPKPIRSKLSWEARLNTLTISAPLTADEGEVLKATVTSEAAVSAIGQAAEASRTSAIEFFQTPAELGECFQVPQLVWREACSFFLQNADGRFYPDFVCRLPDATTLAVEYKGANRWASAEDDSMIGGLWAAFSEGRCRFVMVTAKCWDAIDALLS